MLELSVILPTFNEAKNLPLVVERLRETLAGRRFEIIVVDDDSKDGTWEWALAESLKDDGLRLVRRINRRGLSSAVVEGFLLGRGERLLVMDADLQHDIGLVPAMLEASEDHDLVIGSRYLERDHVPGWNRWRSWVSTTGTRLANRYLTYKVTDPLSGFFMLRRGVVHEVAPRLQGKGFKILLDLLLTRPGLRVKELPFQFGSRQHGESKLNSRVMLDALDLVISRSPLGRFNLQFIHYGMVGSLGVFVHLSVLWLLYRQAGLPYLLSLVAAIQVALALNYILNNQWTFTDQRFLRSEWWTGLLRYNLACSLGTAYNLAIGWYLVREGQSWLLASLLGIWVGISWNWMANKTFTWDKHTPG